MTSVISFNPPVLDTTISASSIWFDDLLICAIILERIVFKMFVTATISNVTSITMIYIAMSSILLLCSFSKRINILTTYSHWVTDTVMIAVNRVFHMFRPWFWSTFRILGRRQYIWGTLWPCFFTLEICPALVLYGLYCSISCSRTNCSSHNWRFATMVEWFIYIFSFTHWGICVKEIHVWCWFTIFYSSCFRFVPIYSNLSRYYSSSPCWLALICPLIVYLPTSSTFASSPVIFTVLLIRSFD